MTDTSLGNGLGRGLAPLKTVWALIVAILIVLAVLDPSQFTTVVGIAIKALLGTMPYIVFAVLSIAYLSASGAEAIIAEAFKGRQTRMIIFAALIGGLAPFCSCEVVPFVAALLAMGVPLGPVMAFWLSSPLIDPPTLLITAGALGWEFAIGKAISAVALGLIGGFTVRFMMASGRFVDPLRISTAKRCGCGPSPLDGRPVWKFWTEAERNQTFIKSGRDNALFLLKWMSLAYLLEGLMITYVPADLIVGLVGGDGAQPIIISALIGAPAYLNGYVAPPLLAGLIDQGMTAGAAMSFMVAGAVSSIPAMTAVWSLVKPQVFATYLGLGIIGAMLSGFAFAAMT